MERTALRKPQCTLSNTFLKVGMMNEVKYPSGSVWHLPLWLTCTREGNHFARILISVFKSDIGLSFAGEEKSFTGFGMVVMTDCSI